MDEPTLVVSGFVGPDLLQESAMLLAVEERLLKSLRDYLEDRLENHFDLVADIAISPTGSMQLNLNSPQEESLTIKEVQAYAHTCVREFLANPLNL